MVGLTALGGLYVIGDAVGSVIYYMKKKIANTDLDNFPRLYIRLPIGLFIFSLGIFYWSVLP